jgi:protein-tyrosine phosphatase
MAVAILEDIGLKRPIEILARGLIVLFPEPLNQKAEAVMISNGLPTEGYMSSPLTAGDLEGETLVLTMEEKQRQKVLEMFDNTDPKHVQVLTEFVGDELEIVDPYGGTLQMYGLCYETLVASVGKLAKMLNEGE